MHLAGDQARVTEQRADDTGRPKGIVLRGISHAFGDASDGSIPNVALHDVDLYIPEGQFVALVGPSGCGKTTVLNIVAGLLSPLIGTASIDGERIDGPSRSAGYMFARDGLLPWRRAVENVELGLIVRGMKRKERRERALRMLEVVGLGHAQQQYPRQLSQGMRQRAAIARTLVTDPTTLLMDEPFAALDAQTKIRIQAEFTKLWESTKRTVLFVTHDLEEAVLLADRVVVMSPGPGRVVADIPITLDRPRDIEQLRFEPLFRRLHKEVWNALKAG